MKVRRKTGRLGAVIAALLLVISGLAVLPASSQPTIAEGPCTPNVPNVIFQWAAIYDDRGVTLCQGMGPNGPITDSQAWVQIIDLEAGARLSVIADPVDRASSAPDSLYNKRTAADWFTWIHNNHTRVNPGRLFSTSNASFIVDTSGNQTPLSMPQMGFKDIGGGFFASHKTYGWALDNHKDAAWDAPKRVLRMSTPSPFFPEQQVEIAEFPTNYTVEAIWEAFTLGVGTHEHCGGNCSDATVAFQPLHYNRDENGDPIDEVSTRTFAGVAGSKVFILNSEIGLTLNEAQEIIQSFGSLTAVQLDGGQSTQLYVNGPGGIETGFHSRSFREVPDTLAVYLAPE